jgi:ACT domain-containing protein
VQTRWSAQLRHILELKAKEGSASIVLQSRRAWSTGRRSFADEANRTLLGLVLVGATVEGGIIGTLRVKETTDSLIVDLSGQMAGRDTVPLVAQCRVGLENG